MGEAAAFGAARVTHQGCESPPPACVMAATLFQIRMVLRQGDFLNYYITLQQLSLIISYKISQFYMGGTRISPVKKSSQP